MSDGNSLVANSAEDLLGEFIEATSPTDDKLREAAADNVLEQVRILAKALGYQVEVNEHNVTIFKVGSGWAPKQVFAGLTPQGVVFWHTMADRKVVPLLYKRSSGEFVSPDVYRGSDGLERYRPAVDAVAAVMTTMLM